MKKNNYFFKNLRSFVNHNPFIAVRIDKSLIIIKPEPYDVCFFVNNTGIQVMNPETRIILPHDLKIWEEKSQGKKQFVGSLNLDKDFLYNIITTIWRITEDLHCSLRDTA